MANELDRIMHEDPLKLSQTDLAALVAYHRSRREEGLEGNDPAPKESGRALLQKLGLVKEKTFKRRF